MPKILKKRSSYPAVIDRCLEVLIGHSWERKLKSSQRLAYGNPFYIALTTQYYSSIFTKVFCYDRIP